MYTLLRSLIISLVVFGSVAATANDINLINVASVHDVNITADRLEKILNRKGMTIFSRINHAAAAKKIGHILRPTELIIFGHPSVGSLLMQCSQSVAIELPQKILIWQDTTGQTWFSYTDPYLLAERHNIQGCEEIIAKMARALGAFAKVSTM